MKTTDFFSKNLIIIFLPLLKLFLTAYCLMPNHIHFLIYIRKEAEIAQIEKASKYESPEKYVSKQVVNLFSSYTQAFNKMYNRKGNLFISNFKRKLIDNEISLENLIYYIHNNPVHHGFVKKIEDWNFSSYLTLSSDRQTILDKDFVLKLFNGREGFIDFHKRDQDIDDIQEILKTQ